MRNRFAGLLLPIAMTIAFVSGAAAQTADPSSAAGLWQKIEKNKPVAWFLVVDHSGIFEGVIAKTFPSRATAAGRILRAYCIERFSRWRKTA